MNKIIRTFLAGLLLLIPFAVTLYVLWTVATWLGGIGLGIYNLYGLVPTGMKGNPSDYLSTGGKFSIASIGAVVTLLAIYMLGLLTRTLLMGRVVRWAEKLIQHLPGVKTIYQSIRDLLKLFGSDAKKMGKTVLYRPNGGEMGMLGILTNANPAGLAGLPDHQLLAVYLPLAFMLGGQIVYVPRKYLQELDIPAEVALKLCATAEIGGQDPIQEAIASPTPNAKRK